MRADCAIGLTAGAEFLPRRRYARRRPRHWIESTINTLKRPILGRRAQRAHHAPPEQRGGQRLLALTTGPAAQLKHQLNPAASSPPTTTDADLHHGIAHLTN